MLLFNVEREYKVGLWKITIDVKITQWKVVNKSEMTGGRQNFVMKIYFKLANIYYLDITIEKDLKNKSKFKVKFPNIHKISF